MSSGWAIDPSAVISEPDDAKKAIGFIHDEEPPAEWFNWIFNQMLPLKTGYFDVVFSTTYFAEEKTGRIYWKLYQNKKVELIIPQIVGANASNKDMIATGTPVPADIRPNNVTGNLFTYVPCIVISNANGAVFGYVVLESNGIFSVKPVEVSGGFVVDGSAGFGTGTNYKGIQAQTVCYALNT